MIHSGRNREKLWDDTCSHPFTCLPQQHPFKERARPDILLKTSLRSVQEDNRR